MAQTHTVKQGECIESIAFEHGFFWETIWNHPGNRELREQRERPNVLRPGDAVHIPDRREKWVDCASEKRHVFRLRGVPSLLSIVVRIDDEVKADVPYVLDVDGRRFEGRTDGAGRLSHPISPKARRATLLVGEGEMREELELGLGEIDPVEDISGVQARLNNLGFHCGEEDGELDALLEQAIADFQARHDLEPTGELDDATRATLLEEHGG